MICESCGAELQDPNQKFCQYCGTPLRKKKVFQYNDESNEFQEFESEGDIPLYKLLDSDFILLFVDPKQFKVWIWQGKNVTTRMKFVSAKIAPSIRDRYGIAFKISSVDEGSETAGFKSMVGLEEEVDYTETQTGPRYEGTKEDLALLKSLSKEKILLLLEKTKTFVVLSYFHRKVGPLVFYSYPRYSLAKKLSDKIANIMEQQSNEGFFVNSFENLKSMNYYFEIFSDWARGNKEMLMISIINKQQISPEIEETISLLCRTFANEMQSNEDIFMGLYISELSNYDETDKERIRKNQTSIKALVDNLFWTIIEETRKEFNLDTRKIPSQRKIKNPHVLIISEEPEILNLSKKFLQLGDYKVITSANTKEALKIIEERYNEISMVLLDRMISYRNLYTLMKEIKSIEKYKDIQVVFFSSEGKNSSDDDDFFPYPYIFKPPTPPGDIGLVGQLQARKSNVKEPEQAPYCKYCGGTLAKGELICPNCGNKVI